MLKRVQIYMQTNPLKAWGIGIAFLSTVYLCLFCTMPGPKKPGLALMLTGFVVGPPTWGLLLRFSDAQRREHPVAAHQEAQVGFLSLFAALASIGTLAVVLVRRPLGLFVSDTIELGLLLLFALSVMLALALGYAARTTKPGRWGLALATLWLVCVVGIAFVKLLR